MSQQKAAQREELLRAGATRLLARAGETRALDVAAIVPRLGATLEKYLLRDRPEASAGEIEKFLDA